MKINEILTPSVMLAESTWKQRAAAAALIGAGAMGGVQNYAQNADYRNAHPEIAAARQQAIASKPISVSAKESLDDITTAIGKYATDLQQAVNKTTDPIKLDRLKSMADGYLAQFKDLIKTKAKQDEPITKVVAAKEELQNLQQVASDIPAAPKVDDDDLTPDDDAQATPVPNDQPTAQEFDKDDGTATDDDLTPDEVATPEPTTPQTPPSFANDMKNGRAETPPAPKAATPAPARATPPAPKAVQSTPQRAQAPSFSNDMKNGQPTGQTREVGYQYKTTGSGSGYTKNGDFFKGEWKNGFPNGYGQRKLLGDQWTGQWLAKGNTLTTEFRGGLPVDGERATITDKDGKSYSGYIKYTGKDRWTFDYRK